MKEQEVYVKVPLDESTHLTGVFGGINFTPVKEITALVFTPEEFEKLAGEIWEAACRWRMDQYIQWKFGLLENNHPDKDTYISSLTSKK